MRKIKLSHRRVANINSSTFTPWPRTDGSTAGDSFLQLNNKPDGVGFHIYKMEPGTTTQAHEHTGDEEFFVISGELIDNDGTVYCEGDLVWLKQGTQHYSYTKTGCILAVYIETQEKNIEIG